MEYTLAEFTNRLIELFVNSPHMPNMGGEYTNKYGYTQKDSSKHSKRPTPRDLKTRIEESMKSSKLGSENTYTFDIGNEEMERNFPYYHILQQAPVIRKAYRGTKKSKGSQMYEKDLGKRDYEKVHWNGKTFSKEYSKNVRGKRLNLNNTTMHIDGQFINEQSAQYLNTHYKYIDTILNVDVVDTLAKEFGMKRGRTQDTGLIDEFANQEGTSVENILEIFESFM